MPISTMKKLTVLSLGKDADAVVRKLMKLRCVEIRTTEVGDGAILSARFDCDGVRAEAEGRLRRIRETIPLLERYTMRKKMLGSTLHLVNFDAFSNDGRAKRAWETVERTEFLREEMTSLEAEITRLRSAQDALLPWMDYDAPLNARGSENTELILGAYPGGTVTETALEELFEEGACYEVVSADRTGLYLAIMYHKSDAEEIQRLLATRGFVKTSFREIDTSAALAYEQNEARLASLYNRQMQYEEQMREMAEYLDDVEILCDLEATNANAARYLKKLALTHQCAVLEGWLPVFTRDAVEEALAQFECAYEISEPDEGEEPPVLLRNNRFAMTFEWVIGMYAYPKYGAFDPTLIMSIFYFILFGLMFADVGYGLLLTLGCFGAIRFLHPRRERSHILIIQPCS